MKIGFRWHVLTETMCGIEEYEPVEQTFDTYAECKNSADLYPEYNSIGICLVRDDDGCINVLYAVDEPNEVYNFCEEEDE
jgi:hypothetical protein